MSHTRKHVRKSSTDEIKSGPRVSSSSDSDSEKTPPKDNVDLRVSASVPLLPESDDEQDNDTTIGMDEAEKATAANSTPPTPSKPAAPAEPEMQAETTPAPADVVLPPATKATALERARAEAIQKQREATEALLKKIEDTKTTLTQTHPAPETTAQPQAQPTDYNTALPTVGKLPPFEFLGNILKNTNFAVIDFRGKPTIHEALFFADVLMLVEQNQENPQKAINAVLTAVKKAQDDHLEHISSPHTYFYNQIACLNDLKPETIIQEYQAYIDPIKANSPTNELECVIKNRLMQNAGNVFAALHLYLQTDQLTPVLKNDKEKEQRKTEKFNEFVSILALETRPKAPKADSNDDFAPNGVIDPNNHYGQDILNRTERYAKIALIRLFDPRGGRHNGRFQKLMKALHDKTEAKEGTDITAKAHLGYLEALEEQSAVSEFANKVKNSVEEIKPAPDAAPQNGARRNSQ
jgi:hypothetical protein